VEKLVYSTGQNTMPFPLLLVTTCTCAEGGIERCTKKLIPEHNLTSTKKMRNKKISINLHTDSVICDTQARISHEI